MGATTTRIFLRIEVTETGSHDLGTPRLEHVIEKNLTWASGTSTDQSDTVWGDSASLAASASELDIRGGLTAAITGSAVSFAEVTCLYVENLSTTTAKNIEVGDASSNPIAGLFEAATQRIKVHPGGFLLYVSPIDGIPVAAGSADVLRLDPGADTISHKTLIVGRSA